MAYRINVDRGNKNNVSVDAIFGFDGRQIRNGDSEVAL